ncbi:MAG TPA: metallophosphoesterase [Chitinophagaceae bacterium]|nr:metallophosphoesterase [Chitinophagaceae bacterium]
MRIYKNIFLSTIFLLKVFTLFAQKDTLAQRIVLIGDAGQLTDGRHPVVDAVRTLIPLDTKTTILFLGDNLYKNGLPDVQASNYEQARAVLDSQVSVADNTPAKVYMIPGNHDWENGSQNGFDAIIRQQLYVDLLEKPNVKYFPEEGCPGPVEVKIDDNTVLILFDSQWWLHPYDKPEIESDCPCKTKDELVTQIKDLIVRNSKKLVLLACHHPFKSYGPHGGYFTLKQHIFPFTDLKPNLFLPLPVLGSIYPIARSVFGTPQDTRHPVYTDMINEITDVVRRSSPNVIFLSGHEHNLEFIKDDGYNYIISGGGCKTNRVSPNKRSEFTTRATGFGVLEISTNKNVTLTFYSVTDSVRKRYEGHVLNFSLPPDSAEINPQVLARIIKAGDTAVAASNEYQPVAGLKKFFMGQNYRREWSQPVNMKVFDIENVKGGLTITGIGGGKHTRSLRLKDKNGKDWALRNLKKNPVLRIPGPYTEMVTKDLTSELNSASFPYGALIVPGLAKAIDIRAAEPELFFVPDDPDFKEYRGDFANNVALLEDRFTKIDDKKTKSSTELFTEMLKKNNHRPYEPDVLKARLLDMLIGDFDRHMGQWEWQVGDTGVGKIYYPIPKDRDQAFFYSNGLSMKLVGSRVLPFFKGFRKNIPDIDWLGYAAKDFDRVFLTSLNAENWRTTIADFTSKLNDSVIRASVKNLPPEIFSLTGENIINKLISRRNVLQKKAISYYNFISRKVNIIGSNLKEYFKVSNYGQGLQVRVYARKGGDTSFIMYSRIFYPSVTKEIRLFGLNDDDIFEVEDNAKSVIKIRIIGGKGNDTFDLKGSVESLLYDSRGDLNLIKNNSHSKNRFTTYSPADSRSILGYQYNNKSFPALRLGYNYDDGFLAGMGYWKRTSGFRNLPYATDQRLNILFSFKKALQLDYKGEFNHITRNIDLLSNIRFATPMLRNFFGLGNNSQTNGQQRLLDYYKIKYQEFQISALLRKRYFERLQVYGGPQFYYYNSRFKDNSQNILGNFHQSGFDSASVFSKKSYIGGKVGFSFNNQNNELFPSRGISWKNELSALFDIKGNSNNVTKLSSDMTIHASVRDPAKIITVLKFGAAHLFNKKYEYFQALTLGAENGLMGFRKNRFAGSSVVYAGIELRIKLFDINSYILPGPFGLTTFYDIGRVWVKSENVKNWHDAYGFGFYFMPFNRLLLTGTAGFSNKERSLNFSIGTKFNLLY